MGASGATLPARCARYGELVGAFGATLPARCARYGELVDAFGATLPARCARYGGNEWRASVGFGDSMATNG